MSQDLTERVLALEAELRALTNVVLLHIAVTDEFLAGTAQKTISRANVQAEAALLGRYRREGFAIFTLTRSIEALISDLDAAEDS